MHYAKPPGKKRIDASETQHPDKAAEFTRSLDNALLADPPPEGDAQLRWNSLRDTIYSTALKTFGKRRGKTQDWFEASSGRLTAVIEAKRAALLDHKRHPA